MYFQVLWNLWVHIYIWNAIKQLMQRQMQYIRCNKAIHNTYDAMKQNITNKTWRSIMINPDHLPDAPIFCFHFCCKQFVSNAHCPCLNQWQQAVWTCHPRNWTQLQLFSGGGLEGRGRGWEGDVGSSVSSPDSPQKLELYQLLYFATKQFADELTLFRENREIHNMKN